MSIWSLLVGGLALAVALPFLLAPRYGDRNRLMGYSVGAYLMAVGLVFLLGTAYVALASGEAGISVKGRGGMAAFSDEPVVASLLLLVNVVGASCVVALGWLSVLKARRQGRRSVHSFEAPSKYSDAERAAAEPEARRQLDARFPGLGRIPSPHFDSLLQVQIDEVLAKAGPRKNQPGP